MKYGRLTVVDGSSYKKKYRQSFKEVVTAVCDCGNTKEYIHGNLKNGHTQSCGCIWKEKSPFIVRSKTHGMYHTATYKSWHSMLSRCRLDSADKLGHYRKRGIKVCKRWTKFENFYKDMGERPKGKTLDRIDTNGNYKPENCRWSTYREQANNKRNTIFISYDSQVRRINEWSKLLGIPRNTIYCRYSKGWTSQKILGF